MPSEPVRTLPDATLIAALARAAQSTDGVAPLSEAFLLRLADPDAAHFTIVSDDRPVAYAQVSDGDSEVVVHPHHRRQGFGTALLREAADVGARTVWSHGLLPQAADLAEHLGMPLGRRLYSMVRPLTGVDETFPEMPEPFEVRTYAQVPSAEALQELNAAAFFTHPEQGRLSLADIQARIDAPWFDPDGLFLVFDREEPDRGPIAFHWTKVEPDDLAAARSAAAAHLGRAGEGEVYVVGVHPEYRGRGLAVPLTRMGMAYLARLNLVDVALYVDGDNEAALHTYTALKFARRSADGQFRFTADV